MLPFFQVYKEKVKKLDYNEEEILYSKDFM